IIAAQAVRHINVWRLKVLRLSYKSGTPVSQAPLILDLLTNAADPQGVDHFYTAATQQVFSLKFVLPYPSNLGVLKLLPIFNMVVSSIGYAVCLVKIIIKNPGVHVL